jgi:2-polyprenyl-6-methoxyphenol hydroxylase-like FAD-dependent oxidoreductase
MSTIVTIGGGFGGLATGLLCARRGHRVIVIERDPPPADGSPDDDFTSWKRLGAPQAWQSHSILAHGRRVLIDELPDVYQAFIDRGVNEETAWYGAGCVEGEKMLLTRRLVAEACLRRIAEREPGVVVRTGEAVAGLISERGDAPLIRGVKLKSGEEVRADLVVDSSGQFSQLPSWLKAAGAQPLEQQVQDCGFFYLTRFYRLRPGAQRPPTHMPVTPLDYGKCFAVGADNGTYSIAVVLSVDDPHRMAFRDLDRHRKLLQAVPLARPWLEAGEPISELNLLSKIQNRRRRLVTDNGPVVGGLIALGDASIRTNPTLGRGISLTLTQAQRLAAVIDRATDDPFKFVWEFENWTEETLGFWFESQVRSDAASLARMDAGLRGERLADPDDDDSRYSLAAYRLGVTDPVVGTAVARVTNMLSKPAGALQAPEVKTRVMDFLSSNPDLTRPDDQPTRQEFEAIATS